MKKTLAFAVSALLAIGMLTGCGSTAEETTAGCYNSGRDGGGDDRSG